MTISKQEQEDSTPWWVPFFWLIILGSAVLFPRLLSLSLGEYVISVVLAGFGSYRLSKPVYEHQEPAEASTEIIFSTFLGAFSPAMLLLNIGVFLEHLIKGDPPQ